MTQTVPLNEGEKTANIEENASNRKEDLRTREERVRETDRISDYPRCDSDTMPETDSEYTCEDSSRSLVQNNSEKVFTRYIYFLCSIIRSIFSINFLVPHPSAKKEKIKVRCEASMAQVSVPPWQFDRKAVLVFCILYILIPNRARRNNVL